MELVLKAVPNYSEDLAYRKTASWKIAGLILKQRKDTRVGIAI